MQWFVIYFKTVVLLCLLKVNELCHTHCLICCLFTFVGVESKQQKFVILWSDVGTDLKKKNQKYKWNVNLCFYVELGESSLNSSAFKY